MRNVPERNPRHAPGFPAFTALRSAGGEGRACGGYVSLLLFRALREMRTTLGRMGNLVDVLLYLGRISGAFPRHKLPSAYLREQSLVLHFLCCFRAGWNSPLAVNRAVPKGCRGAGKVLAVEPMSPRPVCALVRMPAELVRSQYQRLESG